MTDASYQQIIREHCQELVPITTNVKPKLHRLDGIRAAIFDVYGTLLISASGDIGANAGDHRLQAIKQTCELFGLSLKGPGEDALQCFMDEISNAHARHRIEGIKHPEIVIHEIWQTVLPQIANGDLRNVDFRRFSVEYEVRVNPTWPMPGTDATLTNLANRGLVLGIVSNAQFFTPLLFPALLNKSIEDFGFASDLLYFSYEHRQAKPGDYLYREASQQLESHGIVPNEVLYVGNDMLNDITAAATVGFRTALFAGDQRSLRWREDDKRVQGVTPDLVVTKLEHLIDCL